MVRLELHDSLTVNGLTHFNVEADRLGEFLEKIFQGGKRSLDVITTGISLITFCLEITSMLHLLTELGSIGLDASDRHRTLARGTIYRPTNWDI